MSCRFAHCVLFLLVIAGFSGTAHAAPYGPKGREIDWVQPGGEKLKLRVFGDDYYARTETESGFTVVYNPADGAYHYAEVGAKGNALKPSGIKAHLPVRDGQPKHIELPKDQVRKIHQANRTRFAAERDQRWARRVQSVRQLNAARGNGAQLSAPAAAAAQINAAPVTGANIGLTILAQFPNDSRTSGKDPINFPVAREAIVDFCNKVGYNNGGNSGSVRDYFYDQSLGAVTYTQEVTEIVTLPKARNFYNFSDYPNNNTLRDTGDAGRMLIADAVAVLKAKKFDFSRLTVDGSNRAIATNLFFAGPDSGVWAGGLWPHQWNLASGLNVGTTAAPIYLYNYQVTNLENSAPVIGTFIHENGHLLLGYPDIYDVYGEGVGEHCLMGSGNYLNDGKTPAPINAYFKDLVGWGNVTELAAADFVTHILPTTGNIAYRIRRAANPTESFIVENRGKGDKWAKYADDKGIAIWHINETVDGNIQQDPYMVALEQADGANDLEFGNNRGDSSDLFDLASPLFTDSTTPDARWSDGAKSNVRIKVLSALGAATAVQFGKLPPDTILMDSPNGGEIMYRKSTFAIKWEANIVGNVKIDLYNAGVFHSSISPNAPNTGRYDWQVPEDLPGSTKFTIRVSTLTNPKPVFDDSNGVFSVTSSSFPIKGVMPYGWYTPASADKGWKITQSATFEGKFSMSNKRLGDGKTAAIACTSNFQAGQVSFYMQVSSEVGYDFASFYIDGVQQDLPSAASPRGLTGNQEWVFASFPVTAGDHTFTWTYEKDDSYGEGEDTAWIDGVLLPNTTQEIVVEDKNGLSLESGSSTTSFPTLNKGAKSKPETFTIRNTGKADLHGLKIVTRGEDASSFTVGSLGKEVLKPGQSTTFEVVFAPSSKGSKNAEVQILSNDASERQFVIAVEGTAIGIPEITVIQPGGEKLKDGRISIGFGHQTVGQVGRTRTFTVKNTGSADLIGLDISKSDGDRADFDINSIGATTLAPGESTTFKVTFTPKRRDERQVTLHIGCSYRKARSVGLTLKGIGVPGSLTRSALTPTSRSGLVEAVFGSSAEEGIVAGPTVSTEIVDGEKYLSLTIRKPFVAGGLTPTVEVSANLVDWFSGVKHTTVVTDNETLLKVRDNTPLAPGAKRYIRLKNDRH